MLMPKYTIEVSLVGEEKSRIPRVALGIKVRRRREGFQEMINMLFRGQDVEEHAIVIAEDSITILSQLFLKYLKYTLLLKGIYLI